MIEIRANEFLRIISSHTFKFPPASSRREWRRARCSRAREELDVSRRCLRCYGRSAAAFGAEYRRLDRDRLRTDDSVSGCRSSRECWGGRDRTWRMECQLANGAESLIGAERGVYDPVMRNEALMKMNRAD